MRTFGWRLNLFLLLSFIAACTPQPTQEVPQEFKKGQEYFHRVCSNCHGSDALGGQTKAPGLIDTDYLEKEFSDDEFLDTIVNGTDKMPPQKNVKADEITEIIKYLRYSQKAANLVTEEDVADEEEEEDPEEKEKGA